MGIKEWFGTNKWQQECEEQRITKEVEKPEEKVTFESDEELLERSRYVKVGDKIIGQFRFDGCSWVWTQEVGLSCRILAPEIKMHVLIAITEKLKELNGCSALNDKYAKQQREAFNRLCK